MKINTSRFGEIEINEELIFNFIEPILGYDNLKKYVLIDNQPDSPFKWLQSLEDGNIAFPVTFPSLFGFDYQFVIPEEKSLKLELKGIENVITFNIVCIPQGKVQDTTINLAGPIVINSENKNAMQLVITNTKYTAKHKLFNEDILKKQQKKTEKEESKQT
ncbi:MAG TPA: flagellar assembly protein FliW [Candidatus Gastranaerophilales bacterium]|nr:flagellar assembly protein FliW [Candidatus Gastranaerophilales bacterium]